MEIFKPDLDPLIKKSDPDPQPFLYHPVPEILKLLHLKSVLNLTHSE